MESVIKNKILANSEALFGTQIDENLVQFQKTRKDVEGDLTVVIFPFVKLLRCSPVEAGQKIGAFLQTEIDTISTYEVIGGFLNLTISDNFWLEELKHMNANATFGFAAPNSKELMMVEYASPNTNKPLHLGHLRNIFLGYAVAEILKANGNEVIKTQIINDRGIHICKSMLAWEQFSPINENGERETPQNTGMKGDKLVGKYYVEFDKWATNKNRDLIENIHSKMIQIDFENYYDSAYFEFIEKYPFTTDLIEIVLKDDKLKDNSEKWFLNLLEDVRKVVENTISEATKTQFEEVMDLLLIEIPNLPISLAKDMLVKWEARDPQTYLLWSTMNGWVYKGFDATYKRMNVDFDKIYYESDTFLLGKDVIMDGLSKGIFYQKEDNSVWIDLTSDGLDEKLVLRGDGTAVYMTQDIGTAIDRYKDFPKLNGTVYTVGNEQDYHFKVLFLILEKLGYSWAKNCFHLSYGMVELPEGKMKSREGTVVDADDIMQEVVDSATEMTQERGHIDGMTDQEKNTLFEMIGIGGLKYFLLKVDPKKGMKFNPQESIELNGNTAPFIQYAHARIQSLLQKSGTDLQSFSPTAIEETEKELIKQLTEYPATIAEAARSYSPALLANYTFELVKLYNQFYQSVYILNEPDEAKKQMRLVLSSNVAKVIKSAMKLLGIDVPNRM